MVGHMILILLYILLEATLEKIIYERKRILLLHVELRATK